MTVILLLLAIVAGIAGTLSTRASRGLTRWRWLIPALSSYAVATALMAQLVLRLPVGLVYALWTGAAAVALLAIDRLGFQVRISRLQLCGVGTTVVGVVLLGTGL